MKSRLTTALVMGTLLVAGVLFCVPDAVAQTAQNEWRVLPSRVYININGAYQRRSGFSETLTESLYGEDATYTSTHGRRDGILIDGGFGVRVWSNLALGVAVSAFSNTGAAVLEGKVPHPLFFNRFRTVTSQRSGVDHRQVGYHGQLSWFVPVSDKFDFAIFGGPSFYNVDQQVARQITITNSGERFNNATISNLITQVTSGTGIGGNLGVDIAYLFTDVIGVGVMFRWSSGSVDLATSESSQSFDVSGLQMGFGARVRF